MTDLLFLSAGQIFVFVEVAQLAGTAEVETVLQGVPCFRVVRHLVPDVDLYEI